MPTVSVIVPVYNVEKYLERCVKSILSQSFSDFELFLVDDGSTDNSGVICDKLAKTDNRIYVQHHPNQGVSAARNHALDVAIGKWVTFIDSDDFVMPEYFMTMINTAENNSDLVMTGMIKRWYNSTEDDIREWDSITIDKENIDQLYERNILQRQKGPVVKLFKNEIIKNNQLRFNEKISRGEDALFVYDYLLYCNTISVASGANYVYCLREGSLMSQKLASFDSEMYAFNCIKPILLQLIGRGSIHHPYPKEFLVYWFERVINSIYCDENQYDKKTRIDFLESLDYQYYRSWKNPISWNESLMKILLINKQFRLFDWIRMHFGCQN